MWFADGVRLDQVRNAVQTGHNQDILAYRLGLTPVGEVDPRGGIPGLGRGGEQGLG